MLSKVSPYRTISNGNGVMRTDIGGARHPTVNRWKQSWNGNRFAPPDVAGVLYLPGHPGTGTTITDFSGSANHGAITGATWERLPSGLPVLSFNGTTDFVNIKSSSFLDETQDFSILLWFYPDQTASLANLYCESNTGNDTPLIKFEHYSALRFNVTNDAGTNVNSTLGGVTASVWNFTAFTKSGTTWTIYLGVGGSLTSATATKTMPATITRNTTNLGVFDRLSASVQWFDGKMIYHRVIQGSALASLVITGIYQQERHLFGV